MRRLRLSVTELAANLKEYDVEEPKLIDEQYINVDKSSSLDLENLHANLVVIAGKLLKSRDDKYQKMLTDKNLEIEGLKKEV